MFVFEMVFGNVIWRIILKYKILSFASCTIWFAFLLSFFGSGVWLCLVYDMIFFAFFLFSGLLFLFFSKIYLVSYLFHQVRIQPDPFLDELTSMFERTTENGSVWVTLKHCMFLLCDFLMCFIFLFLVVATLNLIPL